MTFRTCSYEVELTQALKDGHWPQGCGTELRAHVDGCGSCRDLVLVTQAFQGARRGSEQLVPSGSASLLWWRAQAAPPECCDRTCEPAHYHRAGFCVVRLCVDGSGFCRVAIQPRFALGVMVVGACAPRSSFSARYLWKSRLEFLSADLRSWSSGAAERAGSVSGIRKILSLRRAHPQHSMAQ